MHVTPHPGLHPVFEALGYAAGYWVYKGLRARAGDALSEERRWVAIAAAALGALAGSRVLGLLEQAPRIGFHWRMLLVPGGKTIVGGLLGGWLAVELAKLLLGIRTRTGDLFAIPLCVGIAVGRVGCFLAGLADDTYGKPTRLPWGVDFGDGIPRHPTQLYEIGFLVLLAAFLWWMSERPHANGALFRVFMGAYLVWRLGIDFIKPQPLVGGMNLIQWACVAGLVAVAVGLCRLRGGRSWGMRKWSVGAKLMTLAAVALLLSIGLCSQGSFEGGTPFQQKMTNAGMVVLIAAGSLFVAAMIAFVVRSMHGDDR